MRDSKTGEAIGTLTRVETFGWPDRGWVKGTVDVSDPVVFRFEPVDQGKRSETVGLPVPVQ